MAIIDPGDLAAFMGIGDTADDPTLVVAAAAANRAVSDYCGRTFDRTEIAQASARVFRPDLCSVRVDDFWETTALAVKVDFGDDGTFESTWVNGTDFYLEPLNGLKHGQPVAYHTIRATINRTFPTGLARPAVQVTAAWGWVSIPEAVRLATLIKAGKLARRKDSLEGVLGGFADFGAIRVSRIEDPDVVALLGPFVRPEAVVRVA